MSGKQTFPETPGWVFEVEEVSAGVYRVRGLQEGGRSVESTGTDLQSLLDECRRYAQRMPSDGNG